MNFFFGVNFNELKFKFGHSTVNNSSEFVNIFQFTDQIHVMSHLQQTAGVEMTFLFL